MKLLNLLAEALSAEKEKALRDKFVQVVDKDVPKGMVTFEPNKISDKEFKALVDIDSTPNGTYLNWLIPRYVKLDRTERKRFFDDGHNEEVKVLLPFFDKNKQRIKKLNIDGFQPDINLYKTLRDFENIIGVAKSKIEESLCLPSITKYLSLFSFSLLIEFFSNSESRIGTECAVLFSIKAPSSPSIIKNAAAIFFSI
jgi:hypothetical protein